jgi:hypothetical protein
VTSAEPAAEDDRRGPLVHVALLVCALGLALGLSERDSGFSVDEGSYAIQAEALDDGGWAIDWPFRALDPDGAHFPYHGGRLTDDAEYAYVSHPAWPATLSVTRDVGSEGVGLRLVPLASVVVAALAAWGMGSRLGGRAAAPWAFWAAAASPLLPNGLMLWAHAPAAALAGLAALAALALVDRPPAGAGAPWWWVAHPAALALLVLARSEGLLFAAAVVGVVGLVGLTRRDGRALALAAVGGASAGAALLAERAWISSIADGTGAGLSSRDDGGSWLSGRLDGAGTALLEGASSAGPALCSTLALGLAVVAVWARVRRPALVAPALVASAALVVARVALAPDESVAGLLVAWPAVALAALVLPTGDRRTWAVLAGLAAFAVAVLATQYDDGGGLQWGGRYLAPALVPLAALVGTGVRRSLDLAGRRAVAGLLVVTAGAGLLVTDEVRQGNADAIAELDALGHPAAIVDGPHLARLDWRGWPERCWVTAGEDLEGAVALLERAGSLPAGFLGFGTAELEAAGATASAARPGIGTVSVPGEEGPGRCPS